MKNNNNLSPNTLAFYERLKELYICAVQENLTNIIHRSDGVWWIVSYETLSYFMDLASETVKRHIKVLLKEGYIETMKVSRGNAYKMKV